MEVCSCRGGWGIQEEPQADGEAGADRRVTDFWSVRTSGEPLRKDFGGWKRFLGIARNAIDAAYCPPPPLISSPTQGPSEPYQLFLSPK